MNCIKSWMSDNFLKLNENKSEIFICASASLVPQVPREIRSPGMLTDLLETWDVKDLVQSCFHQLKNISKFQHIISKSNMEPYSCFYLTLLGFLWFNLDLLLQKPPWIVYSSNRMLLQGSLPDPLNIYRSHHCWSVCTGYPSNLEFSSRLWCLPCCWGLNRSQ